MVSRIAAGYVSGRFSSNGKVLSKEEKAAENVYIKKMEQEKVEKLAPKGPKPEEQSTWGSAESTTDAKPSGSSLAASPRKSQNYGVIFGIVTIFGSLGWFLNSSGNETRESS